MIIYGWFEIRLHEIPWIVRERMKSTSITKRELKNVALVGTFGRILETKLETIFFFCDGQVGFKRFRLSPWSKGVFSRVMTLHIDHYK